MDIRDIIDRVESLEAENRELLIQMRRNRYRLRALLVAMLMMPCIVVFVAANGNEKTHQGDITATSLTIVDRNNDARIILETVPVPNQSPDARIAVYDPKGKFSRAQIYCSPEQFAGISISSLAEGDSSVGMSAGKWGASLDVGNSKYRCGQGVYAEGTYQFVADANLKAFNATRVLGDIPVCYFTDAKGQMKFVCAVDKNGDPVLRLDSEVTFPFGLKDTDTFNSGTKHWPKVLERKLEN